MPVSAMVAGDLAPRGNPDGVLDVADILVLKRILLGEIEPTAEEVLRADVAPLGAPDGELNAGDLVVLMRAVFGEITLPPISDAPPDPPEFTYGGGFVSEGLYVLDGTAQPGATLNVYVNGVLYSSTTVSADGTFSVEVTLTEGHTELYATVSDGLGASAPSPTVILEFAPEGRHVYHLVDPALADGPLRVVSLDDDNLLYVNGQSIPLARDQSYTIPAVDLAPGAALWSTRPISLGGEAGGTDLPVPNAFAATEFVIPHHRDSHVYYLLSPYGDAEVVILRGGTTVVQALPRGEVVAFEAGNDNTLASVLYANRPILVSHKAFNGSTPRDAYPVPPPATELWGVRSNTAVVAALEDATTVWVYASNGSSNSYTLNAGAKQTLAVGVNGAQGTGNALHIVADKPVAAIQIGDGDGVEATAFLGSDFLGNRFGIPVDTQYIAVVCPAADTQVTLSDGGALVSESCSADGAYPGKAYFGSEVNGVHILAGALLESTQPIYPIYETAAHNAERNLLGVPASLLPAPAKPSLDPLASPTQANPVTVTGSAEAGAEVRIYVNGVLGATGTADATTGAFSVSVALLDGINTLEAASWNGQLEGARSNPVTVEYVNEVPRTQSGSITQDTVWTPGVANEPYVITGHLTVDPGVRFTLQPGVVLKFEAGRILYVDGELIVAGSADAPVTFTSYAHTPKRGDWGGIRVRSGAQEVLIEHAVIEWAVTGIHISGVAGTVRESTVREFSNFGIYVNGAGASGSLFESNVIDNSAGTRGGTHCINVENSSPLIRGNRVNGCHVGMQVARESSPTITDGNDVTGNSYGLNVDGVNSHNPQPVVTGNRIYGNSDFNYRMHRFTTSGWTLVLNARGNWWGSAVAEEIGATIYDLNDLTNDYTNARLPTVDYAGFLDGPQGQPVAGNYLIGPFPEGATTLEAGVTYDVLGTLFVPQGNSLTIPAGTVLRFHGTWTRLVVDGELHVAGTADAPVTFTSGRDNPARGAWRELLLRAEGSLIEHAVIEWASTGIHISGVAGTVRESTVREFVFGIYVDGAGASGSLLEGNVIDNSAGVRGFTRCIYTRDGSPLIKGNRMTGCAVGLDVFMSSSPTVTDGNEITGNNVGVRVDGSHARDPQPVVTGNRIYENSSYNYHASGFTASGWTLVLNARGNWWGSAVAEEIGATILDLTNNYISTSLPTVDYTGFLDGPQGQPVAGNYLIGLFSEASTTLEAGVTYDVLGTLFVPQGNSLTIPAGTVLRFHGTWTRLVVDGELHVAGTADAPVTFTSGRDNPARGDWWGSAVAEEIDAWAGILINSTATGVLIEYAVIEYAADGIYFNHSSGTVRNSVINGNTNGIHINGNSSPTLTGNLIAYNNTGIYIWGTGNDASNPRPVITGNDFIGNSSRALSVNNFGSSSTLKIDATGNWWGTSEPSGIAAQLSGAQWVDYSSPASGPHNGPAVVNFTLTERYFSPNGDAIKDVVAAQIGFSEPADWMVTARNLNGEILRTFSGSGTTAEVVWDGMNESGQVVPEGEYRITVTATAGTRTLLPVSRAVTVDLTPPVAVLDSGLDSAMLRNTLSILIHGSALDAHFQEYRVEYGAGTAPTNWVLIDSAKTLPVNDGSLVQWIINSTDGSVVLENGVYTVRLVITDKAGNRSVATAELTIDNLYISEVSTSTLAFAPVDGQSAAIQFTLNIPGTVYLRVYPEQGGGLVREISQSYSAAGTYSLAWDGRATNGLLVPNEAYALDLYATDGARSHTYSSSSPGTTSYSSSLVEVGNAYQNRFWKQNVTLTQPARIRANVIYYGGGSFVAHNAPHEPGTHLILWDGRAPDGTIFTSARSVSILTPVRLKPNAVIVKGVQPKLMGTGTAPHIEIKSNPYFVVHSYEQFSRVGYRVDQDSYVTVKLLPPGVADPSHAGAITLVDNQLKAALTDHAFEWKGYTDAETNKILVSEEGAFTFAIQATSLASGHQTLYRGVLNLHR